jgi:hypothetical protein
MVNLKVVAENLNWGSRMDSECNAKTGNWRMQQQQQN